MRQPKFGAASAQACTSAVTLALVHPTDDGTAIVCDATDDTVGGVFQVRLVSVQFDVTARSSCVREEPELLVRHSVSEASVTVVVGRLDTSNLT
jgi:hypothetical protein